MKKLTIREARQSLSQLDQLLTEEGELTITRRGRAIAKVSSVGRPRTIPSHKNLRQKMARLQKGSEIMVGEDRDGL